MGEVIDPTLVVYSLDEPGSSDDVERRVGAVAAHYRAISHADLIRSAWHGERIGLVALHDPVVATRWPHWAVAEDLRLASAYLPVGWERVVGPVSPGEAAPKLARSLRSDPGLAALELNAPAVLALADVDAKTICLVNDRLGAGRLYEMRFPSGRIWSNRLGALPIFAGVEPEPDDRGWALFAAGGWFMRDSTPIRGAAKVPPASVITLTDDGALPARTRSDAARLIIAGDASFDESVARVASDAKGALRAAAQLFPEQPLVDLSGGRDSRVSAAAAIAAEIDVELRTSDVKPGEADIARELVAASPWKPDHKIAYAEGKLKQRSEPLRQRALSSFLLHDGMRYAGKVRGRLQLPPPPTKRASISGHGGEIGHGFYYTNEKKLRHAREGGIEAMVERLLINSRRTHAAAKDHVYELASAEYEAALAEGVEAGVEGPALLDWFYLMDRFAHRSGLASNTQRITVFSSPSFLQAAFALTPEERLESKLHRAVTAELVPAWREVPYYAGSRSAGQEIRRVRIWEGDDGREMKRILKEDSWQELFEPRRVRKIWRHARLGRGRTEWEQVFERIACRAAFEDWRSVINSHLA